MSKSFDATVQIVVASVPGICKSIGENGGQCVAEYIHEIYKELSKIEQKEDQAAGLIQHSVSLDS